MACGGGIQRRGAAQAAGFHELHRTIISSMEAIFPFGRGGLSWPRLPIFADFWECSELSELFRQRLRATWVNHVARPVRTRVGRPSHPTYPPAKTVPEWCQQQRRVKAVTGHRTPKNLECSELSELSSASELAPHGLITRLGQFAPESANRPRPTYPPAKTVPEGCGQQRRVKAVTSHRTMKKFRVLRGFGAFFRQRARAPWVNHAARPVRIRVGKRSNATYFKPKVVVFLKRSGASRPVNVGVYCKGPEGSRPSATKAGGN